LPPDTCGAPVAYSGGRGWPTSKAIFLGSGTGVITIGLATGQLPDRFIVRIGSTIIIDSGFYGSAIYDFGGGSRNTFKSWINGKIDPITLLAYPDLINFPDDGFPRVNGIAAPVSNPSFESGTKITADDTATVEVYGSSPQTGWRYTLFCPGEGPVTTTSTTTTTTASPETFRFGTYNSPGGVVPIPDSGDIDILSGTLGGDPDGSINIPFNSATDDFIWFAIPSAKPVKTSWFVSVLNQGSIGGAVSQFGNLFPDPVTVVVGADSYNLYISNYRTAVVNMTISV